MLRTDLKIFKSQRMTQNANAGGQRTANEVANGQLNEVFGNISAIDHAQSAVDIVKIYPGVSTANTQLLQDAHVLINEPPEDPKVDVMLIEAPGVTDASVRSNIVEAIESGVTAGQLLRSGLSGMLAGQNSIPSTDLLNNAVSGESTNVYLAIGRIIAIAVEYTGTASVDYPRFTHYAKVLSNTNGNIVFEPPMPFNTPGPSVSVNGQTRVTRLRRTNLNDNVSYHGVTRLTAAVEQASVLPVAKTIGSILPQLTSIVERSNNTPFVSELGLARKKATYLATGSSYSLEIDDILNATGTLADTSIYVNFIYFNGAPGNMIVPITNYVSGVLSFTIPLIKTGGSYSRNLLEGSDISVFYYSTNAYEKYSSTTAWPADRQLLPATLVGTALNNATALRRSVYTVATAPVNQLFVNGNSGRELAAEINIDTGAITYYNNYSDLVYTAILANTAAADAVVSTADFVLAYSQYQADSLYITAELQAGGLVSASADASGIITGTGVSGTLVNGVVSLTFTAPVMQSSIRYDINEITQLTPPASLYSINQLRIANGGAVPIFREFGVVSITHNQYSDVSDLNPGNTLNQRPGAFIDIVDSTGASLWHPLDAHYSYNKTTGVVTIVDASAFTGPFEVTDTIGELALVAEVNDNQLVLTTPIEGSYPAGSVVSSVQVLGNLQAAANVLFDMTAWENVWSDTITGSPATGNFNELNYPIEVQNQSAINERWVIVFTSPTAFNCIGEGLGLIASGDTLNDFAPINPNTLQPYFVIRKEGWGGGWNFGECVRFNTEAAAKPLVLLRSVSAGHSQIEQDSIRLHFRGNAD
ncbi:hypothetical protein AAY72_01490 [Alishewanella sp. WH16-1]|uniref:hypothetical protein n=1 Tax=Alishewanella sp. WH16-1 TaxID=1651088 RepID=UPI00070E92BF|nr:hypothetical protein [Alishewanella sp. WH16-1]KRS22815.1 hypothetical protein AAY72_01490 [Alishewanella sp. WH16-1]